MQLEHIAPGGYSICPSPRPPPYSSGPAVSRTWQGPPGAEPQRPHRRRGGSHSRVHERPRDAGQRLLLRVHGQRVREGLAAGRRIRCLRRDLLRLLLLQLLRAAACCATTGVGDPRACCVCVCSLAMGGGRAHSGPAGTLAACCTPTVSEGAAARGVPRLSRHSGWCLQGRSVAVAACAPAAAARLVLPLPPALLQPRACICCCPRSAATCILGLMDSTKAKDGKADAGQKQHPSMPARGCRRGQPAVWPLPGRQHAVVVVKGVVQPAGQPGMWWRGARLPTGVARGRCGGV